MNISESTGAKLRNDTAIQLSGPISRRLAITAVVALGMGCTPVQQDLVTTSAYISTTSYAPQNRPDA
ncbi:MAG: hypothetical protein MK319_07560, partial [Pseudomonadales bacterium]|nr:hypothetical protein [Pseudomonadales bacterium]